MKRSGPMEKRNDGVAHAMTVMISIEAMAVRTMLISERGIAVSKPSMSCEGSEVNDEYGRHSVGI